MIGESARSINTVSLSKTGMSRVSLPDKVSVSDGWKLRLSGEYDMVLLLDSVSLGVALRLRDSDWVCVVVKVCEPDRTLLCDDVTVRDSAMLWEWDRMLVTVVVPVLDSVTVVVPVLDSVTVVVPVLDSVRVIEWEKAMVRESVLLLDATAVCVAETRTEMVGVSESEALRVLVGATDTVCVAGREPLRLWVRVCVTLHVSLIDWLREG